MSEQLAAIGDLLRTRLWPFSALAFGAVVAFCGLGRLRSALERSGKLRANASRTSLWTDIGYLILSPIPEVLSRTLAIVAIAPCAVLIGRELGPDLFGGFGPVMRQPRWLVVSEMFVLSDFIYYWTHRMAHTVPALWRLHAVHHSTKHLRWTSALRAHPAEVYSHVLALAPLFLLGFPVEALAALTPLISLCALFIHTDSNFSVRKLSYVFNSPRYHGWHHALDVRDGSVNFAGFFPVFDALFGTYRLPEERPAAVGIDDPAMPETCLEQIAYPFRTSSSDEDRGRAAESRSNGSPGAQGSAECLR